MLIAALVATAKEDPLYSTKDLPTMKNHEPEMAPEMHIEELREFAENITVIIQSCNDCEYYAALEQMKPPDSMTESLFTKPVRDPRNHDISITLGMFAGRKSAIVRTEQGILCQEYLKTIHDLFPKTMAVLGLGVAYGMDRRALLLSDVLVASQIIDLGRNPKIAEGRVIPRGENPKTKQNMLTTFCTESAAWRYQCTKGGRYAKAVVGQVASSSILVDWDKFKNAIIAGCPDAKGGEMEGWVLYTYFRESPVEAIIIKGIADYGDGTKDKLWQLTAAKAAVNYAHYQLMKHSQAFKDHSK